MLAASTPKGPNGFAGARSPFHTVTALKRWSCDDKELPPVATIKAIHVYDFDNTLFASPLPNKLIWSVQTIGQLMSPDLFINGGWWHDSNILAATGMGLAKEEPLAWNGWWNEQIVSLVEISMQQKDVLSVLLTGRSEAGFADLIKRMVRSKKLEFDMICLKPATGPTGQKFRSTMAFKQELLKDIIHTYHAATDIRMYEDRPGHTRGFRDFFFQFNKDLMANQKPTSRKPIIAEVVQVTEEATQLEQVTEVAEIQKMINSHNEHVKAGKANGSPPFEIKRTVFYTGYMIQPAVSKKLISLVKLPSGTPDGDIRYLANSVLITPKPCPTSILEKVGGKDFKVNWKVTGVSCFENKLWVARVEAVPTSTRYYTENPVPTVVLATRKSARPADAARVVNWHPVPEDQAYTFESFVGEKAVLRIEEERADADEYESYFPHRKPHNGTNSNGFQSRDDRPGGKESEDRRAGGPTNYRGGNQNRGRGNHRDTTYGGGRGGRGRGRGRGGPNPGRGRGGNRPPQRNEYRSLDDVSDRTYGQPNYDDPNGFY
ncbi:hypothetical protein P154DRAFT_433717 [Amniculicola lignicola CBS 123094]|uniref:Swiss Army Knife RNA repair protein HAD domain-containing protein n=1 Tax=Amniculicola lignicola CBS 123094 TaxID=1392246 RepID=A0A6A5WGP3_9PLEO|nr:hypothetical protein P154DRAFT_433717 [Amniculicola lignicola CBS 123094]